MAVPGINPLDVDPYGADPYGADPLAPQRQVRGFRFPSLGGNVPKAKSPASDRQIVNAWLDQQAPVPEEITPEQREGLMSTVGSASLGGLAAVGNFLDVPGSFVRDTLSGENPFDQLLPWNWFTHEGRMTGRDMTTKWGLTKENDPDEWEWADLGGFMAELATDPLMYLTAGSMAFTKGIGGLNKFGRAVHKAKLLEELPDVARRLTGRTTVGMHEARGTLKMKDILGDLMLKDLHGASGLRKRVAEALKSEGVNLYDEAGELIPEVLEQGLGGGARIGIPFTNIGKTISPTGGRASRQVDTFNRWISNSAPGRITGKLFDSTARGLHNKYGQVLARTAARYKGQWIGKVADEVNKLSSFVDEGRGITQDYVGSNSGERLANILGDGIPGSPIQVGKAANATAKLGDVIAMPVSGNHAIIVGQNQDTILVKMWHSKRGEYVSSTLSTDELTKATLVKQGTSGLETDLVESVVLSFLDATYEGGYRPARKAGARRNAAGRFQRAVPAREAGFTELQSAMDDWDLMDALGVRTDADIFGHRGIKEMAAEGKTTADILESMERVYPQMKEALDGIQARALASGIDVNRIGNIGWLPRDVARPVARELAQQQQTIKITQAGEEILPGSPAEFNVRMRGGRTPVLASLPQHHIQRMLNDIHKDSLRKATEVDSLEDIRNMLTRKHETPLTNAGIIADADKLDELAKELYKHSEWSGQYRGQMYKADTMESIRSYVQQMSNIEATHAASLSLLHRSIQEQLDPQAAIRRTGTVQEGKSLGEVLLESGHDIKSYGGEAAIKSAQDEGKYAGSLTKLFKAMGVDPSSRVTGSKTLDDVYTELSGEFIPKDVANQLTMVKSIVDKDDIYQKMLAFLDKTTRMFKGNVTLPFPSFAMRNHFSGQVVNVTSGNISGIGDLLDYFKAFWQARRMSRNPTRVREELGEEYARYMNEIHHADIVSGKHLDDVESVGEKELSRFYSGAEEAIAPGKIGDITEGVSAEASRAIYSEPKPIDALLGREVAADATPMRGTKAVRKGHRAWLATGSKFNRMVEWQNRASMFIYLRKKGFSIDAAKSRIDDLQFDYGQLAPFEKQVMRRAIPFYAFTRKMAPLFFTTLAERPGGALAQVIRGSRLASQETVGAGELLPEHITQQTTIPFFKPEEEGAKSFLTDPGMAHADPISYLGGLSALSRGDVNTFGRRAGLQAASRLNPFIKFPLEALTSQSFFQTGPGGHARRLDEQNPTISQLISNIKQGGGFVDTGVTQTSKPDPIMGSSFIEHLSSNLPTSRFISTARMIADPRKGIAEKLVGLGTGVKTTTLSPYQLRKAARDQIAQLAKEGGYGGVFKSPRIDRIKLVEMHNSGKISERQFRDALLAQSELNRLARSAYKGSAERKLERISQFSTLP